jgi:hypothetical protein
MISVASEFRTRAAFVLGCALAAGLGGLLCWSLWRRPDTGPSRARSDEATRLAAVDALVAAGQGAWDSFPDPDVGRVLQPGLRARKAGGIEIDTNRYGQREREYAVPKPAGVLRVVLLGDSFVYGNAVRAEERLGAVLERELTARAGLATGRIECLHVGMVGWNLRAECQYLRRALSQLEPDLVVHVTVHNDLEDSSDARGFGTLATFSSQQRARGDGIVSARTGQLLDPDAQSLLPAGLDWESRSRYADGARELAVLAAAVEARGGRYVALFHWPYYAWKVRDALASALRPEQVVWLPTALHADARYTVSPSDRHWNAAGHAYIARMLYALLRDRRGLAAIEPPEWAEATTALRELHDVGSLEANSPPLPFIAKRALQARRSIDTRKYDDTTAGQVHAGLDPDGLASPYVSVLLSNNKGQHVLLRGRRLARRELSGTARVYVDEFEVGQFPLDGAESLEDRFALPAECAQRGAVSVRIASDDWVYAGADLRHTVCFELDLLAIER